MAFFEEIGKKISDAGQGVAQQTKNFTDITKLNGLIHEKEKKINQFYLLLGQSYYEKHKDSFSNEEAEKFNEIATLLNEVKQYREEIKQIKGVQKCTSCGADVPLDSQFCNCCGAKVANNTPNINSEDLILCPACNASIKKNSSFCTKCGCQINKTN